MMAVAYYTEGTPYKVESEALAATLREYGVPFKVFGRPHPGSWASANALNAGVIAEAMDLWPGQTILYLDADARLMAALDPAVTDGDDYDVGLYYLDKSNRRPVDGQGELCSGTMVWRQTPAAKSLLAEWQEILKRPETLRLRGVDQEALQVLLTSRPDVRVRRLPDSWCWIDTISTLFGCLGPPVVYHTQASRRHKRTVGG